MVLYMKDKDYTNVNNNGKDRSVAADPLGNPGINTPEIIPPAYNPPVPNRAWTAMRAGKDIDELTEEERRMLYYGKDEMM